jgi:FtsZ-interacting cell division protein ZipA
MIDRLIGAVVIVALVILGGWWFKGKLAENQRLRDTVAVHEQAAAENEQAYSDLQAAKEKSDNAAADARRRAAARQQATDQFRGTLNARISTDPASKTWADTPVPGAVAECLRDPGACSGASGGTSPAAHVVIRADPGAVNAGPDAKR